VSCGLYVPCSSESWIYYLQRGGGACEFRLSELCMFSNFDGHHEKCVLIALV
jgi:hypothetical protein